MVNFRVDIDTKGDPPRVWCMDHDYPGTAFSRSLGDTVGEDIGVNAGDFDKRNYEGR